MRAALPLLLPALAVLAGCNAQPAATNNAAEVLGNETEAAPDWAAVFGDPAQAIGHLNQFGYRIGAYAPADNGYAAAGQPVLMSQSDAKSPNYGSAAVSGATADAIDRIEFTVTVTDEANVATARKRLADNVRNFLFQYRIEDGGALAAVESEQDADGMIGDAPVSIAVDKGEGPRRITVTLQRPAASDPAGANTTQP